MRSKRRKFLRWITVVGKLQQITLKREFFRVFTQHPRSDRLGATFYDTFVDFNPLFIQNICNFQLREFFRGTQKNSLENFPLFFFAEMISSGECEWESREDFYSRKFDRFFSSHHHSRVIMCVKRKKHEKKVVKCIKKTKQLATAGVLLAHVREFLIEKRS